MPSPLVGKAFLAWIAAAALALSQSILPSRQDRAQASARVVTVKQLRSLCARGPESHSVRVRGYYAAYTFFGPGPPATPVTYQTGYLFGHKVRTPIDTSTAASGILVLGPQYGFGARLPAAGRVQINGRWNCSTFRLRLKSWKPWTHS